MLKAIPKEDKKTASQKTEQVAAKFRALRLEKGTHVIEAGAEETFSFYCFPSNHLRHNRTNNPLERLNREIRRRTREVGNFPDGHSALMLVAVRLRYLAGKK